MFLAIGCSNKETSGGCTRADEEGGGTVGCGVVVKLSGGSTVGVP